MALLETWRAQCSDSHDIVLLLDFPKRTRFELNGGQWEALKHGSGVMFFADDLVVDVPYAVERPDVFESGRFFDYLKSRKLLNLLGDEDGERRETLTGLLLEWSEKGLLERRSDERGRTVFSLSTMRRPI